MNRQFWYRKSGYKKGVCLICGALCRINGMMRHSEYHAEKDEYKDLISPMWNSHMCVTIGYGNQAVGQSKWMTDDFGPL